MLPKCDLFDSAPALCQLGAEELAERYSTGDVSPVEVAKATIEQAFRVQESLNAFTFIDVEGAMKAAKSSEDRWRLGSPMSEVDGIPTTLKELVWVDGWKVRFGSNASSEVPLKSDAPSVALLRKSGVVFIGQTASPEFGWKTVTDSPIWGATRNPWNRSKTPGGSSGGGAVAAAAGAGVFHLGTDAGGSIRIPASFTGIVGMKPTFARVPNYPPSGFFSLSHTGPMARTVDDVERMLRAMLGRDLNDWSQRQGDALELMTHAVDISQLKVAFWSKPLAGPLDPEVERAVNATLAELASYGAAIVPFDFPAMDVVSIFDRHWLSGAALKFATLSEMERNLLDPGFHAAAERGSLLSATDLLDAQVSRARFGAAMDRLLCEVDVVISPATSICAFDVGLEVPPDSAMKSWPEWSSFSYPLNLSGQPACVIPCDVLPNGLPIGIQIFGARGQDDRVLAIARAVEALIAERGLNTSNRMASTAAL
ncbi:amidase [Variovorax sp. OV700]|uniref:amidase n=1 Tax=Variovorax sp. OV700 TaxID=1882826 RepID=UPI00088C11A5|nr:amidase [Variovorax sp. OV700]SDJ76654.1 amidase/aspartyl-tRNA(Asn)/glutamyl-tRNA(Gln) amidotransferase subunit A [Variovorax sp. OV700]